MADAVLEIDLGDRGGVHRFKSVDAVHTWIAAELQEWNWLAAAEERDNFGLWNYLNRRLTTLREEVARQVGQGIPLSSLGHLFSSVYVNGEIILHSESELGQRVNDLREAEGAVAARAGYAVATKRATLQQMVELPQLRGLMLLALPGIIPADAIARRLAAERRNLKARADRMIDQLETDAAERWKQHRDDRRRGREIASGWVRRRFNGWQRAFAKEAVAADELKTAYAMSHVQTKGEFEALKAAFTEQMRLQAPAEYWRAKAEVHRVAEQGARRRLYVFFPTVGAGLAGTFFFVASRLLDDPPGANATPLYFIISAGLGTLAGMTFWVGRLLTKLYLSEHHLRIDAEEREIMTSTYLALTKDQAADEKDRQIILAALFRNTPDGIVKDDGMADSSIAALLARVISPTK